MANSEPWHLDRRVPIALIATIAIQTLGAVWWAATIHNSVNTNRTSITRLDAIVETMRTQSQLQAVQMGRIEENITAMRADLARLLISLERDR